MDIEGFEYLALLGAKNILKKFHPKIVVEIHSTELRNKIKKYLERFGYKLVYEDKKFGLDFYLSYFMYSDKSKFNS